MNWTKVGERKVVWAEGTAVTGGSPEAGKNLGQKKK